jgi:hypothetical protein
VQIQAIENNLSIDNMDFEEFAGAVGSDGVFRGFGPPQPEPTAASPVHRTWDPIRDAMLFHPDEILRRPRLAHVLRSPRRELGIALSDPDLLEALYDSPPAVRDCAVRAAVRRLAERAGIAELPWVVPALEAVAGGLPLPAPFDDYARLVSMIDTDPAFAVPATEIAMVGGGNQTVRPSRIAVAAILGVHGLPSEDAALRLVSQVLYGSGVPHHRAAINELRTDLGLPARTQWPGGPAGFITELE